MLIDTSPNSLLLGNPRYLTDEWQEQLKLWNLIRNEVDKRVLPAQFILTVSANTDETAKKHSGSGRFTTLLQHCRKKFLNVILQMFRLL